MTSITDGSVSIQTTPQSVPSTPCWLGEVTLVARYLRKQGVFAAICERVRFARRRFGRYEVIDFLAVQIALRHQWRTYARSLLRSALALCLGLYGAFRPGPSSCSFDTRTLFGSALP
jgi:hypothetical protein